MWAREAACKREWMPPREECGVSVWRHLAVNEEEIDRSEE
jgi:hypothetical protein